MMGPQPGDIIPLTSNNGVELGDLEVIKCTIVTEGLLLDCRIISLTPDADDGTVAIGSLIQVPIKLKYRE